MRKCANCKKQINEADGYYIVEDLHSYCSDDCLFTDSDTHGITIESYNDDYENDLVYWTNNE